MDFHGERSRQVRYIGQALRRSVFTPTTLFGEAPWHFVSLVSVTLVDQPGLSDRYVETENPTIVTNKTWATNRGRPTRAIKRLR